METQEKQKETPNQQIKMIRNSLVWIAVILGLFVVTLPFHYVPSAFMVFPKNELTFSHTIITENYIDDLIKRMNEASYQQQQAICNDPLVLKLMEKGLVVKE
ncbi:MAG: hypothetical protein PF448_01050 [Bacteroidales bacterium]|jgi:hypothetical protein|nr:hypothetical protein [Bacteroidales bacterium]